MYGLSPLTITFQHFSTTNNIHKRVMVIFIDAKTSQWRHRLEIRTKQWVLFSDGAMFHEVHEDPQRSSNVYLAYLRSGFTRKILIFFNHVQCVIWERTSLHMSVLIELAWSCKGVHQDLNPKLAIMWSGRNPILENAVNFTVFSKRLHITP